MKSWKDLQAAILFFLLFSSSLAWSQPIRVMSWNIKELGNGTAPDRNRDWATLREVLQHADLIAIQEVRAFGHVYQTPLWPFPGEPKSLKIGHFRSSKEFCVVCSITRVHVISETLAYSRFLA